MPTIKQNLTNVNYTSRGTDPSYIVIHNTANGTAAEGTAWNNTNYFKDVNRDASATYFIDDGDVIWQCVRDTDTAWHCGESASRNGVYNYNSIGIEVCESDDGWFTDNEIENLRWLVQKLMDEYDIPASHVCRHHDVTGKNCPWRYVDDENWSKLMDEITSSGNPQNPGKTINNAGFNYRAHVQNHGWLDPVRDGQVAGTTGKSLRMECLKITPPAGLELTVKAHIQGIGWKSFKVAKGTADPEIGTVGKSKRLEAIEVVCNKNTTGKTLYYKVHVSEYGWGDWVKAGYAAGTVGIAHAIEAIQFKLE